jgi:hypothetical protein
VRTALIVVNFAVAVASAVIFGYTFFAREHLIGLAEEYAIGKTVEYATPAVEYVEAALNHPAAILVPGHIRAAVRAEVDAFRQNPNGYVRELTARGAAVQLPNHPLAAKAVEWKNKVRDHFENVLAGLIRDLRIFAGTNVVAALLGAVLAYHSRGRWRYHVLATSVLLLAVLGFQIYLFIDGLTFFRIISDARVGWSYPLTVALVFGYLYLRFVVWIQPSPVSANPAGPGKPTAVR